MPSIFTRCLWFGVLHSPPVLRICYHTSFLHEQLCPCGFYINLHFYFIIFDPPIVYNGLAVFGKSGESASSLFFCWQRLSLPPSIKSSDQGSGRDTPYVPRTEGVVADEDDAEEGELVEMAVCGASETISKVSLKNPATHFVLTFFISIILDVSSYPRVTTFLLES